jgi:hypothetical protein
MYAASLIAPIRGASTANATEPAATKTSAATFHVDGEDSNYPNYRERSITDKAAEV